MSGGSTSSAIRAPATRWCDARCASSRAAFSTARSCSSPSSESTRRAISAKSRSRLRRCPARPTKSTSPCGKEKPSGAVLLGVGFSNIDKFIVQASVQQSNFFGTGNTVGVQVATGSVNKVASLSFTDPYYTVDGVSRGFDLYRRDVNATSLGIGNYRTSTVGGGVRFGVPFTEYDTLFFGLGTERVKLFLAGDSPQRYLDFQHQL